MPSTAYEIGLDYTVDKTGTVIGPDNLDLEDALRQQGFVAATREYDAQISGDNESDEMDAADCPGIGQHHPGQYADPTEPPADEMLRKAATWMEGQPESPESIKSDETDEPNSLSVEYPLGGFNPETLGNLTKMVASKTTLIKAALGAEELPIQMTDETVRFPWFTLDDPGHAACYTQFIWALCQTAKGKKRVTAIERGLPDNPRYTMRCWLLSLGLIGGEYAKARKLLLSRLGGNSSFKSGKRPTYTAHCYTYPNGSEEDAMDCAAEHFTSLAKAKAHVDAFAANTDGIYFAGANVEDEKGNYVYELLCG